MKIRQTVKKAVALGTGALMLGATILGASAANVNEYPAAFIKDGQVNAKIVVGEKAAAIDVLGAIDVAADLQANAVSKESVSTTGTGVTVSGGKTKEIALGATLSDFGVMGQTKIPSLKDEKITWDDKDIDVKETIDVTTLPMLISQNDADFGSEPVLGTVVGGIKYAYTLSDTDLNTAQVSSDEPLKVEILGKPIEIINASTGTANQLIISIANEYYLNVGDSMEVDGKKITLKNVATSAIVVDVDGVQETVTTGTGKKVNGIRVQIVSTFDSNTAADRAATLKIGDKITQTIKDGDSLELFGEPSKEADAEWVWDITTSSATKLIVGAEFNQVYDTPTEPVKKMGEKLTLPNDYASVYMDSLTAKADAEINFAFKDGVRVALFENASSTGSSDALYDNQKALVVESNKEIFKVNVSGQPNLVETDTVYFIKEDNAGNTYGAFRNSDGDLQVFAYSNAAEAVTIDYESTDGSIAYTNVSGTANPITVTLPTATFTLNANISNKFFGTDDSGYMDSDYTKATGNLTGIAKDQPYLTSYGIIVSEPETQLDKEQFTLTIPSEQVKMNVVVVGKDGSSASGAAGSVTTDKVNPIGVDFGVLDSDAPAAGTTNLIIVGGPCVNTEASRIMGNPTDCAAGFAEGEAKLAMFNDGSKVALLVAGYSGQDTLAATRALVTASLPAKSSAKVITTNIKNPTVQ